MHAQACVASSDSSRSNSAAAEVEAATSFGSPAQGVGATSEYDAPRTWRRVFVVLLSPGSSRVKEQSKFRSTSERAAATCLHNGAFGPGFPIEGIAALAPERSSPSVVEALG